MASRRRTRPRHVHARSGSRREHRDGQAGSRSRSCALAATARGRSRRSCATTSSASSSRNEPLFAGIVGFEETVVPQVENAILSGQDIIFLGERGQAKTRIARACSIAARRVSCRCVAGCEINDDPLDADLSGVPAARGRGGRRARRRLAPARPPLRREARHPGHHHRRPDRRGRPDQGRRGALPLRRADDPLRPAAADAPRHLRASTSCPTWPSASRSACSTSWRSATSRSAATRSGCRSTSSSSPPPTPRTTPTAAASSRRSRTASARRSARTIPRTVEHEMDIMEDERTQLPRRRAYDTIVPPSTCARSWPRSRTWPASRRTSPSAPACRVRVSIANYENLLSTALKRAIRCARRQVAPRISDLTALVPSTGGKIELETVGDRDEEKVIDKLHAEGGAQRLQPPLRAARVRRVAGAISTTGSKVEVGDTLPSLEYVRQAARCAGCTPRSRSSAGRAIPPASPRAIEFVLEGLHLQSQAEQGPQRRRIAVSESRRPPR